MFFLICVFSIILKILGHWISFACILRKISSVCEKTNLLMWLIFTLPYFLRALETNRYNHITATYFLLAERILREKQEKEIQTRSASPSNIKAQFR